MAERRSTPASFPLFRRQWSGGVSAELVLLLVEQKTGAVRRQPFRFDTGADLTIIPGELELELNLDFPGTWASIKMTTAVGDVSKRIIRGRFHTRLPGFGDEDFEWP